MPFAWLPVKRGSASIAFGNMHYSSTNSSFQSVSLCLALDSKHYFEMLCNARFSRCTFCSWCRKGLHAITSGVLLGQQCPLHRASMGRVGLGTLVVCAFVVMSMGLLFDCSYASGQSLLCSAFEFLAVVCFTFEPLFLIQKCALNRYIVLL